MIEHMKNWFSGLSVREQALLGIAALLGGLVLLVYGIALPSYAATKAAEKELDVATERRGRIEARAALVKQGPATAAKAASALQSLESVISEGAASGGFEIATASALGVDEYSFRLASAKAGPLMMWLTNLEAQGIDLAEIKMQKIDGGFVSADIRVRRKS